MTEIELTAPHHLTVGYVGGPGEREFFLQAEDAQQLLTVKMEKIQVQGIGDLLAQLLARIDDAPATDWDHAAMQLREPMNVEWRVREIALGIDDEEQLLLLELGGLTGEGEAVEARLWFDRDNARRLAAHATQVVGEGRPHCELCGSPTALDGAHVCPSTNGHGTLTR